MARVRTKVQGKQLYTTQETAEICGVSAMTVYRWVQAGRLTAVKMGDSPNSPLRITRASLEALLGEPIAAPIEVEPAPIDAAPSDASPSPGEGATGADVDAASAAKPGTGSLADVFTSLEALREAIERALANPHYFHVKGKIGSVRDVLGNISQELHKAEGLADADAAPSDASPSPGEGATGDPGAGYAQD